MKWCDLNCQKFYASSKYDSRSMNIRFIEAFFSKVESFHGYELDISWLYSVFVFSKVVFQKETRALFFLDKKPMEWFKFCLRNTIGIHNKLYTGGLIMAQNLGSWPVIVLPHVCSMWAHIAKACIWNIINSSIGLKR